jgi:Holliday junction resolvase RusA-like endonuclease
VLAASHRAGQRVISITIPRVPQSINALMRIHWRYRQKHSKLWNDEVFFALHQAGYLQPRTPYAKAKVTIHRAGRRELDPDNLVASIKVVVDALRYAHVLVDDSPKHIKLIVTQSGCYNRPHTRIDVQPLK